MRFEKHLFISYAHLDNVPLSPDQQGWISRFHQSLEALLSMRLGLKARVWRDMKLAGNDIFGDEILAQFPKTAILVSILSPRYVVSDWCAREVEKFCEAAAQSGGLVLENKARIIKVIKTPVDREDPLPAIMREMLGYPFYVFDEEQAPLELDPAYGSESAEKYNVKLAKLAWDIAQMMKKLDAKTPAEVPAAAPAPAAPAAPDKPVVYLATCSYDRRESREALEADLKVQGYRVVPERQLPSEQDAFLAEVGQLLDISKLAVHFIGSAHGAVPDGPTEKSTVILQHELALAKSRSAGLGRVIWLPEGTASTHPAQQQFIQSLLHEADVQFGADVITAKFEDLKGAVQNKLKRLESPIEVKPGAASPGGASKLIYLVCDERDRKATVPIRKALRARGHEVETPLFEGDAAAVSRANEDILKRCDAVLVYYGAGDAGWRRAVQCDLRKIEAFREGRPILAAHTYLAEPSTADKVDLIDMEEPGVTNGLAAAFSEDSLTPFVKAVEAL